MKCVESGSRTASKSPSRIRLRFLQPCETAYPLTFRTFLDVAGLPSEDDTKLIRFWPPAEWILTDDSLLVFADFLIDSHRYALWTSGAYQGAVSPLFGVSTDP